MKAPVNQFIKSGYSGPGPVEFAAFFRHIRISLTTPAPDLAALDTFCFGG